MALAIISLPVPLSPVMRTFDGTVLTLRVNSKTSFMRRSTLSMSEKPKRLSSSRLKDRTSLLSESRFRHRSIEARRISLSNGFRTKSRTKPTRGLGISEINEGHAPKMTQPENTGEKNAEASFKNLVAQASIRAKYAVPLNEEALGTEEEIVTSSYLPSRKTLSVSPKTASSVTTSKTCPLMLTSPKHCLWVTTDVSINN